MVLGDKISVEELLEGLAFEADLGVFNGAMKCSCISLRTATYTRSDCSISFAILSFLAIRAFFLAVVKSRAEMMDRVGSARLNVTEGLPLPGELLGDDDEEPLFDVKDLLSVCDSRTKAWPFDEEATRAEVVGRARDTGRLPVEASLDADSFWSPEGGFDCLRVLLRRILLVGSGIADWSILDGLPSGAELGISLEAVPGPPSSASSGKLSQLRALATLNR